MNLDISYSLIRREVSDLLIEKYENNMGSELPRIDGEYNNDCTKIALKLAEYVIREPSVLESLIETIKEICTRHVYKDEEIVKRSYGLSAEQIEKARLFNDELQGRCLLYEIEETINRYFFMNNWPLVSKAETEVRNRLCKEEKGRML